MDDGGRRSGATFVELRGRQCQAGEGEEEVLRREGDNNDNDNDNDDDNEDNDDNNNDGYRGGGCGGGGKKGKRYV